MKTKGILGALALTALLLTGAPARAALTADQRLDDFTQLVNIVERSYGPLRWKKENLGLDFPALVAQFRDRVQNAKNDPEFYRTLAAFVSSFQDAHVEAIIPSNYAGGLGFTCDLIEGKVLIDKINPKRLPPILFPFQRGDQLLALGGVPVEKLLDQFAPIGNTGNPASARRIAAARITSRREAAGMEVPKGVTTVTVLPRGKTQPVTVTATWYTQGTPLVDLDDMGALLTNDPTGTTATAGDSVASFADSLRELPEFRAAIPAAKLDDWERTGIDQMGEPRSMFKLPEGATELPDFPVTAAVYEAAGKRIGLLRINSYADRGLLDVVSQALVQLEDATDVLVLDQTNNPGGDVTLVSDLASLFADKSFQDFNFLLRPSLSWLDRFQGINTKLNNTLKTKPDDQVANALKARFTYLEDEVRDSIKSRRFYTSPVSLNFMGSFGTIQPDANVRYTKPVLLLVNEFDFSGGDMFPAIMQDNGRAKLFGARTTGAGGSVREFGPLANSFFKVNLTESLMVRPNGKFIENLGVTPDIAYTVTEDDFLNGYQGYVRAFTEAAVGLVGVTPEQFAHAQALQSIDVKPLP